MISSNIAIEIVTSAVHHAQGSLTIRVTQTIPTDVGLRLDAATPQCLAERLSARLVAMTKGGLA